ncbi:hypothetical protein MKW98_025709 [Papaver atlanticum]|uniref:Flavin-containing monooxygenase n=1 Tax=Papaver atlanticum TaxID=357466 RepID=A0AAD4XC11_9MAGN|nr:hypothetical protein MKW98_025709 [Papaver atlanticum]
MEYIHSYALHFNLYPYIKFNTKVININYLVQEGQDMLSWSHWGGTDQAFGYPKGKWEIATVAGQEHQVHEVEFVILCIGRFSGVPNIPDFPPNKGPDAFLNGKVIHSMDYSAMDDSEAAKFVRGKRVVVVGLQKSALDIADECAIANEMLIGMYLIIFHTVYILVTYTLIVFLNSCSINLATLLSPLRWAASKFVESYIKSKFPLKKYNMVPEHSFLQEISSCSISTAPEKFYDKVEEGSIIFKQSRGFSFYKDGLVFDDDVRKPLETDVVILATGYKGDEKLKNIFKSPTFQNYIMGSSKSTVALYRECIHPRIPQLAVIGYSESVANLYTSEMMCRWLAHLLVDGFKLPSIKRMEKNVLEWEKFFKRYSGQYYRHSCIGVLHIWYNDQLCKDMGCNPRRKKGFYAEMF